MLTGISHLNWQLGVLTLIAVVTDNMSMALGCQFPSVVPCQIGLLILCVSFSFVYRVTACILLACQCYLEGKYLLDYFLFRPS